MTAFADLVSMTGGITMAVIGVLYVAFEDYVLSDFSTRRSLASGQKQLAVGRLLIGTQASLVFPVMVEVQVTNRNRLA